MNNRDKKAAWQMVIAMLVFAGLIILIPKPYNIAPALLLTLTFYILCDHIGGSVKFAPERMTKFYEKIEKRMEEQNTLSPRQEPRFPEGTRGFTKTKMMPSGRIEIEGQSIEALSVSGPLEQKIEIEVVGQELNQLKIRKVEPGESGNGICRATS
jgi:membrane-bound ClpP family serine protease